MSLNEHLKYHTHIIEIASISSQSVLFVPPQRAGERGKGEEGEKQEGRRLASLHVCVLLVQHSAIKVRSMRELGTNRVWVGEVPRISEPTTEVIVGAPSCDVVDH